MATRIVPKTQLRDRIRAELAHLGDDTLVVTDRGRPVAVTVSVDRWNALQELIENLEDLLAVIESRAMKEKGRSLSDVLAAIEMNQPGSGSSAGEVYQ